jgi:hypothetical protein
MFAEIIASVSIAVCSFLVIVCLCNVSSSLLFPLSHSMIVIYTSIRSITRQACVSLEVRFLTLVLNTDSAKVCRTGGPAKLALPVGQASYQLLHRCCL